MSLNDSLSAVDRNNSRLPLPIHTMTNNSIELCALLL